ncbi:hypothetical protein AWENTII_008597 [Aspergillus wentii]
MMRLLILPLRYIGRFESFVDVTRNALLHALAESGANIGEQDINNLMTAYDSMCTFDDVNPALSQLASTPAITPVIFSNGSTSMVSGTVFCSKELSPHSAFFQDIITVEDVKQYKPAPAVYKHLADKVGKDSSQWREICVVTTNTFEVIGARNVGMNAIWVDRRGTGWIDRTVPDIEPTETINSLNQLGKVINSLYDIKF